MRVWQERSLTDFDCIAAVDRVLGTCDWEATVIDRSRTETQLAGITECSQGRDAVIVTEYEDTSAFWAFDKDSCLTFMVGM